jgi:hypothetical protein
MDLSPLGRENLTKTTGSGWLSLPLILDLKMSSSVTVDKADIATLTAALAAAQDRLNAANEAANVAFRTNTDFKTANNVASQCEAAATRAQAAGKSLDTLVSTAKVSEELWTECTENSYSSYSTASYAAADLRMAIADQRNIDEFITKANEATARANLHAEEAEKCYRDSLAEICVKKELGERQNRANADKIAAIRNSLDKAMNAVSKIKENTDTLDKYTPNVCEDSNYAIRSRAINIATEAAKDASILFASFVEKFNELGLQYSTFTVPRRLSPELCAFLGVPNETMLSRSEVTTRVCRYAKVENLLDKCCIIKLDTALCKLLSLTPDHELMVINLQRRLAPHFLTA